MLCSGEYLVMGKFCMYLVLHIFRSLVTQSSRWVERATLLGLGLSVGLLPLFWHYRLQDS